MCEPRPSSHAWRRGRAGCAARGKKNGVFLRHFPIKIGPKCAMKAGGMRAAQLGKDVSGLYPLHHRDDYTRKIGGEG